MSWQKERRLYLNRLKAEGINDPFLEYRCSGKTTARALEIIAHAIIYPDKNHPVIDHGIKPTRCQNKRLLEICGDFVRKLELEGFTFYIIVNQIRFSLNETD